MKIRKLEEEVSTELGLSNSVFRKKRKVETISEERLKLIVKAELEEELRLGACLGLKLYNDPWKFKKVLTKSDVDGSSRLLLAKDSVKTRIIPFMDDYRGTSCKTLEGVRVTIFDFDEESEHELVFKTWPGTGSFVITSHWTKEFVDRRRLAMDDKIGLFWDRSTSRLYFSVLQRAEV